MARLSPIVAIELEVDQERNWEVRQKANYSSSGKSGLDKASKFAEHVRPYGWDSKIKSDETGMVHLFARRGESETIDIWWQPPKGAITIEAPPMYTLAGERIKLLNVSACVAIATKPADMTRISKALKKQTRRRNANNAAGVPGLTSSESDDVSSGEDETPDARLQAASDVLRLCGMGAKELRAALIDREITWINSLSGKEDSAIVGSIKKVVHNDHPYVEFTNHDGFHAVHLDRIVSVI